MLVILSPAKTMDMSVVEQEFPGSTPKYTAEAEYLAEQMRRFSESQLEKMLKISPKLAAENYERYQRFGSLSNPRKQALLAYNGSVFKAIDPNSFSLEDLKYAQDRVRIISTLYGLVRPLEFDPSLPDRVCREVGWGEPVRLLGSEADDSIIGRCA